MQLGLTLLAQLFVHIHYWIDAFFIVVLLINILPSYSLSKLFPHEKLLSSSPNYLFLRVVRCLCFSHLHPFHTNKLSFKFEPCVFLGQCSKYYGYRCLSPSGRVYTTRNVVFHETKLAFADSQGAFFISSTPKHTSTSQYFFIPCNSQFLSLSPDVSYPLPNPTAISLLLIQLPTLVILVFNLLLDLFSPLSPMQLSLILSTQVHLLSIHFLIVMILSKDRGDNEPVQTPSFQIQTGSLIEHGRTMNHQKIRFWFYKIPKCTLNPIQQVKTARFLKNQPIF